MYMAHNLEKLPLESNVVHVLMVPILLCVLPVLINIYTSRPTQLFIYYNTATCVIPLIGPSSGCQIKTFKRRQTCIQGRHFFLCEISYIFVIYKISQRKKCIVRMHIYIFKKFLFDNLMVL
jgi:hypothetical protein